MGFQCYALADFMTHSITALKDFEELDAVWRTLPDSIKKQAPLFVLPVWFKAWWGVFGVNSTFLPLVFKQDSQVIGIAPMKVIGKEASLIGSDNLCDYLDFTVLNGNEAAFFGLLLDELERRGITSLDLPALRPDSNAFAFLADAAKERGHNVSCRLSDLSLDTPLPDSWEGYLAGLSLKQRHEVRRKLRRLAELGEVSFRVYNRSGEVMEHLGVFLDLFRRSRTDKASFMDGKTERFFRSMVENIAGEDLLGLGFLELDGKKIAATLFFDYNNTRYLYNSGYEPAYAHNSAGLISKALCIKDAIDKKLGRFDFLKGAEVYKYYLGGQEIPIHHCSIELTQI